jgi:hypothetical protein
MTLADAEAALALVPASIERIDRLTGIVEGMAANPRPRFSSVARVAEQLATHTSQLERP